MCDRVRPWEAELRDKITIGLVRVSDVPFTNSIAFESKIVCDFFDVFAGFWDADSGIDVQNPV